MSTKLEQRLLELAQVIGADVKGLKASLAAGTGSTSSRVDGGRADTVYTSGQVFDGGGANG